MADDPIEQKNSMRRLLLLLPGGRVLAFLGITQLFHGFSCHGAVNHIGFFVHAEERQTSFVFDTVELFQTIDFCRGNPRDLAHRMHEVRPYLFPHSRFASSCFKIRPDCLVFGSAFVGSYFFFGGAHELLLECTKPPTLASCATLLFLNEVLL